MIVTPAGQPSQTIHLAFGDALTLVPDPDAGFPAIVAITLEHRYERAVLVRDDWYRRAVQDMDELTRAGRGRRWWRF